MLGALEYVQAASAFGMLVVVVLLAVRPHFVRPCGELGEGNRTDRHFVWQFGWINPVAQDQDVCVEEALIMGVYCSYGSTTS